MSDDRSLFDIDAALDRYLEIMREIRFRIDCCNHVIQRNVRLPDQFADELIFLQFRKICELIALSCLVAHGDIKAVSSPKMEKAWSADLIMRQLANIHPEFYPVPQEEH